MFRHILHHPEGEPMSLAHNYLRIEMLHLLHSIRCIIHGFYNVIYNY